MASRTPPILSPESDIPTPELSAAESLRADARAFGTGFVRFKADGSWERIDPEDVYLTAEEQAALIEEQKRKAKRPKA